MSPIPPSKIGSPGPIGDPRALVDRMAARGLISSPSTLTPWPTPHPSPHQISRPSVPRYCIGALPLPSVPGILGIVSDWYRIPSNQIMSRTRRAPVVWARHVLAYLLRLIYGYTQSQIAKRLSISRDLAGYAIRRIRDQISLHPSIKNDIDALTTKIRKQPQISP